MLKIKDNVHLKELEKFGFVPEMLNNLRLGFNNKVIAYGKKCKVFDCDKDKYEYIVEVINNKHRELIINGELLKITSIGEYNFNDFVLTDLDIIYDLIQAGLVEKI